MYERGHHSFDTTTARRKVFAEIDRNAPTREKEADAAKIQNRHQLVAQLKEHRAEAAKFDAAIVKNLEDLGFG